MSAPRAGNAGGGCAGVLLTGGASRRMERDKATILWRGETLAARAARVLAAVCEPVVEVGAGVSGLPWAREEPPGSGPLAAVLAGVRVIGVAVPVIVLACDLPFVEAGVVRLLADWPGTASVVPVVDGREQYACARYGPDALDRASRAFLAGARSLRTLAEGAELLTQANWGQVGTAAVFADLDTPEDLDRLGLS